MQTSVETLTAHTPTQHMLREIAGMVRAQIRVAGPPYLGR